MIYLFQRTVQNSHHWTRPSHGRLGPLGEGKYVQQNGFGYEDWNFNDNMIIEGSLYGYCYYNPTKHKRDEQFNIAFATYSSGQWYLIGFYLDCTFVNEPPVKEEVLQQKMRDLRHLDKSLGREWRKLKDENFVQKLRKEAQVLKWRVSPNNAIRTLHPIAIPNKIFDTKNYRIVSPTELDKKVFDALYSLAQEYVTIHDYGNGSEFPEGKEVERKHKSRERNQAVIKAAKRAFELKEGKLYCQICGFDFYERYGQTGLGYIEGHHTKPISQLKNQAKTKVKDIALVCSNCHKMLHLKRPWLEMKELKRLIDDNS